MPVQPFIVSVGPNLELGEKHEESIARQVYGIYFYFNPHSMVSHSQKHALLTILKKLH
jgi:hypothetical protein